MPLSLPKQEKHIPAMTKLLEKALEAVRRLSSDGQDEIARAMLTLAGDEGEPEPIDPAHFACVAKPGPGTAPSVCDRC